MSNLSYRQGARRALGALPLCAALLVPSEAGAQTPEDVAAARALGTEGTRLADAGDCNGAIPKLEAAEKLFHAPTTLDRLGECQISVGRIVAGTESLNRVVREPLSASSPAVFVAAKRRAQQALSTAQPRIGNLRIHVEGAPADKVAIAVDGATVSSALIDADRPTDPGAHSVTATAPGFKPATENVTVREGGQSAVSLKLEVDPAGSPAALKEVAPGPVGPTTTGVTTAAPPSSSASTGPNHTPAIVAFAVGGVGLVVGTVFGVLALGAKSTLDNECTNKICPGKAQPDIDSIQSKSMISTIGFAVGIAGIAVGGVLLAVSHGPEASAGGGGLKSRSPHVSPWVGIGTAGIGGTFE